MNKDTFASYLLWMADNNVIMGQRLAEWCGHGPFLEEDIALTNLALDHVGQSQLLYDYAAELREKNETQDDLAFLRDVYDYRNNLLVELPNGDFACTVSKIFLFSAFQLCLYTELANSPDERLSDIAVKSIKEVKYHFEHSSSWVERLGDGTEESHDKMQTAINDQWEFAMGMFIDDEVDTELSSIELIPAASSLKDNWIKMISEVIKNQR